MCPHTLFKDIWISKNLQLEIVEKLYEEIEEGSYVHLQGWGEPLMHPEFTKMCKLGHEKGLKIGLTTNAFLLTEKNLEPLVEYTDNIAVSVAGAHKETHQSIRVGSIYDRMVSMLRELSKRRGEKELPNLVITFLMQKRNIKELPDVVKLAHDVGFDEVIATNLDYIPNKQLYDLKVFSCEGDIPRGVLREYRRVVDEAKNRSKELGIKFTCRSIECTEQPICIENPCESALITVDGNVTPCVYLHLPTNSDYIPRCYRGKEGYVKKLYFGSLLFESLESIWNKEAYVEFRETYRKRMSALPKSWLEAIETTHFYIKQPAPEPCRTCYKLYGV